MRRLTWLGTLLLVTACAANAPNNTESKSDAAQLTQDDVNRIKEQIEGCWQLPAAGGSTVVYRPEFRVAMNPDGTVRSVDLLNTEQLNDQNFVAAANSGKEALLDPRCQPLNLPPEKYSQWQTFTITFSADQPTNGPFDGVWTATVGPQGGCEFTSVLSFQVAGSVISGSATNPLGAFPLTGKVEPSGEGVFKIVAYSGIIRFSGNRFEANYANDCGARFALGFRQSAMSLSLEDQPGASGL